MFREALKSSSEIAVQYASEYPANAVFDVDDVADASTLASGGRESGLPPDGCAADPLGKTLSRNAISESGSIVV